MKTAKELREAARLDSGQSIFEDMNKLATLDAQSGKLSTKFLIDKDTETKYIDWAIVEMVALDFKVDKTEREDFYSLDEYVISWKK